MSDDVKIFEGSQIRSVWDNEREEWYFSVVDVIGSLTESNNPRDYWYRVKKRMSEEESEPPVKRVVCSDPIRVFL